jgi:demethylmenaquinone methyltransferase/2-methoxy-6-polyprenyl-1,4-benzoquinol methylase
MQLVEVYDRNAAYWDSKLYRAVYHGAYVQLFRTLKRTGSLRTPADVLDCGIGAGLFSESFLDAADGPAVINGIDLSSKLLEMTRLKFHRRGVRARLAAGDICQMPYPNEAMQLVISALVLEHVVQPGDAVREMTRVVRHRGLLVIVATRRGAPDHFFRLKYRYKPYRERAILQWMEEAGLKDVKPYTLSGLARFFARGYVGVKA